MRIHLVYMTARDIEEAREIGRHLVTARLVACVNIIENVHSIYLWQERLQDERECVVIAKTDETKVAAVIEAVKAKHSYECPCIVSMPVGQGNSAFLEWVAAQVK